MNQQNTNTSRPTAVIDMSVLREICEQEPDVVQATLDWLVRRYQLVFPFALIEEAFCRWVPAESPPEAEGIVGILAQLPQLWMEDIHEIIARELLDRRPPDKLPGCSTELRERIMAFKKGVPEAAAWLKIRESEAEQIEAGRRESKKLVLSQLPAHDRRLNSEGDLFRNWIAPFWREFTSAGKGRLPLVDHLLGRRLKRQHPELTQKFDEAFTEFLSARWTQFYLTAGLLLLRFAYLAAPSFTLENPRLGSTGAFIKIGLNDRTDEEYIASAFLCERLLTQDLGMARIMAAFEDGGFWKVGKTIYLPKGQWLSNLERFCN